VVHEAFELAGADWVLELADGLGLDLADLLTSDFEDAANLFHRIGVAVADAVAELDNPVLVRHHHGITISGCQGGVIVNNLSYNPYGGNFLAGILLSTTHGKTPSENTVVRNNLLDSEASLPRASNTSDHNIVVNDPKRYFSDPDNLDMRHKQGSPAIDAGSAASAPKIDIDNVPRPQGAGIDIGPYEFENAPAAAGR